MTMPGPAESLGHDLEAWAAEELRIDVSAPAEAVRAAYLRQVEHDNGGPNLSAREALLILTGRSSAARPVLALETAEQGLQQEVDAFAARFFKLGLAERKAEWEQLRGRGRGLARIEARLAALRLGLDIVLPQLHPDLPLGQLMTLVCELFVLRPAARAALRHTRLQEIHRGQDVTAWMQAATALRKSHAAIAALEPELVARLADGVKRKAEQRKLNRKMHNKALLAGVGSNRTYLWILLVVLLGASSTLSRIATDVNKASRSAPQKTEIVPRHLENDGQGKDLNQFIDKLKKRQEWLQKNPGADPNDIPAELQFAPWQPRQAVPKKDLP
jgi:hypothetical protein